QVYDPADPMGKMFFNILATFAEFEVDLLRMRTREGMAVARAKASCMASSRSCPPGSSASWPGWPPPASTPSPTSPRCSPSPAPPSTAAFSGPTRKPPPAADTRSPTESLFFRWKLRVGHLAVLPDERARLGAPVEHG